MSETIVVPDNGNNMNNAWPWLYANNNNGLLGGAGGWGAGILGFLIGTLFNGGWGNGFGFGGNGGNGAAAASLGAQATAYNNADLIMQAVTSQGEQSRQAVQTLSNALGQDFNLVNGAINTIQTSLATIAANQGMNALQVINAIQSGDANLASQFSNCCCQTQKAIMEQGYQGQIATLNQTAAMNNGFAGVNTNIAATKAAQQLSDCQQTYALTDTMNRNYIALDNKLDAMESGRKDREITALTAKVAQLESQNFTVSALGQAVAPINAQLASLSKEVDDIKCKQPSTVSVQYPNLVALNATPYVSGGFYGNGYGYNGNGWFGNGWNNGINF